jgi:hypothetical protein
MELHIWYITRVRYLVNIRHYITKFIIHTGRIRQKNLGDHNGLDM